MKTTALRNDHDVLLDRIAELGNGSARQSDTSLSQEIGQEAGNTAPGVTSLERVAQVVAISGMRCKLVERLFQELSRMKPSDDDYEVKMKKAISEIGRLIEKEEDELDELLHEAWKAFTE